jgi:hypothetical protein
MYKCQIDSIMDETRKLAGEHSTLTRAVEN